MSLTVLTIDDSRDDTLLLRRACQRARVRFTLQWVDNGAKAIAYLSGLDAFSDRSVHPLPNLVLLDLKMPVQTGFEVLDWIRGQHEFKSLPVAVFTASQHEADVRNAYEKGANCFLFKPLEYEQLIVVAGVLDKTLENEQSLAEALRNLAGFRANPRNKAA